MKLRFTASLVALSISLTAVAPSRSWAAAPEVDVTLENGATNHGTLVEKVPGDHITIQLVTGEIKRFEWKELAEEGAEEEEAPKPKAKKAKKVAEPTEEESGYYVTLKSEQSGVFLEREVGRTTIDVGSSSVAATHWVRVCSAPCGVEVSSAGGVYRLSGDGMRSSSKFTINRNSNIEASLGGQAGMTGGVVLLSVGATFLVTGLLFARTADREVTDYDVISGKSVTHTEESPLKSTGYVMLAGGAVALALGIVLIAANTTTVKMNGTEIGTRRPEVKFAGLRLTPQGFVF